MITVPSIHYKTIQGLLLEDKDFFLYWGSIPSTTAPIDLPPRSSLLRAITADEWVVRYSWNPHAQLYRSFEFHHAVVAFLSGSDTGNYFLMYRNTPVMGIKHIDTSKKVIYR